MLEFYIALQALGLILIIFYLACRFVKDNLDIAPIRFTYYDLVLLLIFPFSAILVLLIITPIYLLARLVEWWVNTDLHKKMMRED